MRIVCFATFAAAAAIAPPVHVDASNLVSLPANATDTGRRRRRNLRGNEIPYPRIYSAKIRGRAGAKGYNPQELSERFFVMEVDALDMLEEDLPPSHEDAHRAANEGLGGRDFARISFLVHDEEDLDRASSFSAKNDQGRVSSRSHASEMKLEIGMTEAFLAANFLDAEGFDRRERDPKEGGGGRGRGRRETQSSYATIPGFSCYRSLAGTYAFLDDLSVMSVPGLAIQVSDIGDSWKKSQNDNEGYDIRALKITGDNGGTPVTAKGVFFAMFAIHAREYATAETGARFAERLIEGYGNDAGITALLDHNEVHLVLQANPDGRARAETGVLHRKNMNDSYGSCTGNGVGVDLNRNFPFKWGLNSGSSGSACSETYRGPSALSEPETQAIASYVDSIFPTSQRKANPEDPPDIDTAYPDSTATGVFFDVHAYGEINIWPWGWVEQANANDAGLQALARKMRSINGYELAGPNQSGWIYEVSGSTKDHAYGNLGVSSATLELGTAFFQACSYYESSIADKTVEALLYAASVAKLPYSIVKGPEVTSIAYSIDEVAKTITVTADVSDIAMLLEGSETTYLTGEQNIASVSLYIDEHPDDDTTPAPVSIDMNPVDGSYDEVTESVTATASFTVTGSLHVLHIQATDSDGYAGPIKSQYFNEVNTDEPTSAPTPTPVLASYDATLGAPACNEFAALCDASSGLVNGRGTVGPEPNAPNTLDGCADGNSGTYLSDESIEGISVRSEDWQEMKEGSNAIIKVDVHAWSTGSSDAADFYHAADATNPSWRYVGTQIPGAGLYSMEQSFTLAEGSDLQAVRVNFRYQGSVAPCTTGSYNDRDDLAFKVAPSSTDPPTGSPSAIPSTAPSKSLEPSSSTVPSAIPSVVPTVEPSDFPSMVPSVSPSKSAVPSAIPSVAPTVGPSDLPSTAPSASPTILPSATPSAVPTESPMPSPGTLSFEVLSFDSFESSFGNWLDAGSDANSDAETSTNWASDGSVSVRLRDDSSTSMITSASNLALSSYSQLRVKFTLYVQSMENNEALWFQVSFDGGSNFQTWKTWRRNASSQEETNIENNNQYDEEIIIDSAVVSFTDQVQLRFRLDAGNNGDYVYIDAVEVAAA